MKAQNNAGNRVQKFKQVIDQSDSLVLTYKYASTVHYCCSKKRFEGDTVAVATTILWQFRSQRAPPLAVQPHRTDVAEQQLWSLFQTRVCLPQHNVTDSLNEHKKELVGP